MIFFIIFVYTSINQSKSTTSNQSRVIYIYAVMNKNDNNLMIPSVTNTNTAYVKSSHFSPQPKLEKIKTLSYSVMWKYGDKPRDDFVEVIKVDKNVVKLSRWTTFKSFHFPEGAIVIGFRGRRDYKDGNCEGIMCRKWCSEVKAFTLFIFTISNGYNGTFSEKDFETIEHVNHSEFTFYNSDAVKNIKSELR